MIYTGIGSRKVGPDAEPKIKLVCNILEGTTLRSGGANGSDMLFEKHHKGNKEIYLPWKNFNGNKSPLNAPGSKAKIMAMHYHPIGENLKHPALLFHARNCYQVLGSDLNTPTDLVICYTSNMTNGGTSQALRIATDKKIPIINLIDMDLIEIKLAIEKAYKSL